jgi:D-alanyl-D-alanine carboxypeptidase
MRLIENFGADDRKSMAADNTSAFNGRYVSGTRRWSMHAYGIAIDINPVENPYVSGSYVSPPQGRAYADRSLRRRGMIFAGGRVVQAFAAVGWEWGGYWRPARDYQHFSANGR